MKWVGFTFDRDKLMFLHIPGQTPLDSSSTLDVYGSVSLWTQAPKDDNKTHPIGSCVQCSDFLSAELAVLRILPVPTRHL